jgi:2-octaprenyl-6-methoxyphenol hydroxylase
VTPVDRGREAPSLVDVAVVGAGPVGATVAALLARPGVRIALYEARPAPSSDARTLALSHASRGLLESVGAWPEGATAIRSIHISQKGGPGRTLLECGDQGLPALGYTLGYAALESALWRRVAALGIAVHAGEACEAIELHDDLATARFTGGREARARLLVLADGGTSAARIPGIAFREKDYAQVALVAAVRADKPHAGRAYERFTPTGPVALLPLEDRFALVWSMAPQDASAFAALDEAAFLAALQEHFGDRAGRFIAVERRASFPLRLRTVNAPVALRTAIVGNAAQALHPIAGQGLNLGLRDAAALAAIASGFPADAWGTGAMLSAYRDARHRDVSRGVAFTDFLVGAFADSRGLPTWLRGAALTALDLLPPARRAFAERMIHGAAP